MMGAILEGEVRKKKEKTHIKLFFLDDEGYTHGWGTFREVKKLAWNRAR